MAKPNIHDKFSGSVIDLSDERVFKDLFMCYFAPLCVFAKGFVGNFHDEDIVASVFQKFYQQGRCFADMDEFVLYLYRSVRNKCLDTLKADKRMADRNRAYCEEREPDNLFEQIMENEMVAEMYREIRALPSSSKKIIEMSYLEELSNQEIADELSLSVQTIKNYKHKAVMSLKNSLLKIVLFFFFFL